MVFFKDTFRRERSLTYQNILKQRLKARVKKFEPEPRQENTPANTAFPDEKLSQRNGHPNGNELDELYKAKVTIRDINPFQPIYLVLRRWNNVAMLFVTGAITPANSKKIF